MELLSTIIKITKFICYQWPTSWF